MSRSAYARAFLVVCSAVLACACNQSMSETETGVARGLALQRAASISNLSYELRFDISADPAADIAAQATIELDLSDVSAPLQLDFREEAAKLGRLTINGTEAGYEFRDEHIILPQAALRLGRNRLVIEFTAGSTSLNRNPDYLYTLFVPDRARTAFPVFDQPDLKATYELTLVVPSDWRAISNAPLASLEMTSEGAVHRFERSDLISSYLFSFVAGRFEAVTRERNGRRMTMLHREQDADKVARNTDAIFDLHAAAIEWLEDYTGIAYPWQKLDFALIPAFQYNGMEHVGAIQYRASSLMLDESPPQTELLRRAALIAHETAHMWFGDLVTMRWFDDVWTKEVFANFMAAKIVNPSFPGIDHDLSFLVRHYPSAYAVDRSEGANAIRQDLANLNEAGQMYGPIIYDKAPIMMRQLEMIVGEDGFQEGMREYLARFAFANATWPELIAILDAKTPVDLAAWSDVWVNTPGRPEFELQLETPESGEQLAVLHQRDPAGLGRVWPQRFSLRGAETREVVVTSATTPLGALESDATRVFNADGLGYGLFPADLGVLQRWAELDEVEQGSALILVYEQVLAGTIDAVDTYLHDLLDIVSTERNELILELALDQLSRTYVSLLTEQQRRGSIEAIEATLWQTMLTDGDPGRTKILFEAFASLAENAEQLQRLYQIWSRELEVEALSLSEDDDIDLAATLAIRLPNQADAIIERQLERILNPDSMRRLEFIVPSLSPTVETRDAFFVSLALEQNRQTESWVIDALRNLHHPSRLAAAEKYVLPSLALLEEIQATGDIFFPTQWLVATLENHRSAAAAATVRDFLAQRPGYNAQLRMKILQAADMLFRSTRIVAGARAEAG